MSDKPQIPESPCRCSACVGWESSAFFEAKAAAAEAKVRELEQALESKIQSFEEWWALNGPTEASASYRGNEWALTVLRNMCQASWLAALHVADKAVKS